MARKAGKATSKSTAASAPRSFSKRAAPDRQTPSRQPKRARVTPAQYAELDSDDAMDETEDGKASDFEADSSKDLSSESGEEEVSDDQVEAKKGTARGRPAQRALPLHKKQTDEKKLWESGAKLPLGTQLVMKKPKARDTGDTPYAEDTIHPNTMLFLQDLAANNERQWLKLHDPDYRAALQDFTTFLEKLSEKVSELDETIPELPVKDLIFRIYRDVRFSKSQIPYKTHFSAAFSRTGRKGPYASYYVQIQPGGESFVGGGLWQPEANSLSLIRRDIDRKPHKLKRVLMDPGLRGAFFGGIACDEKKAIKAFTDQFSNQSTALKRHPKGYDGNHKDIELIRLRSFTLGTKLSDDEVLGANGLDRIAGLISCMVPFITHLNSVVMPDEPSESSDDGEDDGEDEGDSDSDSDSDDGSDGGAKDDAA